MASNAPGSMDEFLWGKAPSSDVQQHGLFTEGQNQLFQQLVQQLSGRQAPQMMSLAGLEEFTRRMAERGLSAEDEEYLSRAVDQPLTRTFKEETMPSIARKAAGGGTFYGSERIRSDERATRDLMDTLARTRSKYAIGRRGQKEQGLLSALGTQGQLELGQEQASLAPMQLLAQILGIPQMENIGFQYEGTEGLVPGLLQAGGQFAGSYGAGMGMAAALSDERLKEDIEPIKNALNKLEKIKGVMWSWNEKARQLVENSGGYLPDNHAGVLAQEVEKQFPALVKSYGPEDTKHVDYNGLIGVAIEAIKELSGRVEALEG